jgi:hypothetical protein
MSAASATVSAGALVFLAAGTGPAQAETRAAVRAGGDCKLGPLLCGILGGGKGKPAAPPKPPSGGGHSVKPRPHPKPRAAPAHPRTGGSGSDPGSGQAVPQPIAPPAAGAGPAATQYPQETPPALPDITSQDPLVFPEAAPADQSPPAHLVAETRPAGDTMPPLLIATAAGISGAVAALNLSMLNRRLRRPRYR